VKKGKEGKGEREEYGKGEGNIYNYDVMTITTMLLLSL
jgi:hypothetical protein